MEFEVKKTEFSNDGFETFYITINNHMKTELSHFDSRTGRAKMVDIGDKNVTSRIAVARSVLSVSRNLAAILTKGTLEKGDAFTVAKTAGILAAKQTGTLIPMCHPLSIDFIDINIRLDTYNCLIHIQSEVCTTAKTGVEMEALTAVTVASLTIYDMCKAVDESIIIQKTGLYRKTGGKRGTYINSEME